MASHEGAILEERGEERRPMAIQERGEERKQEARA